MTKATSALFLLLLTSLLSPFAWADTAASDLKKDMQGTWVFSKQMCKDGSATLSPPVLSGTSVFNADGSMTMEIIIQEDKENKATLNVSGTFRLVSNVLISRGDYSRNGANMEENSEGEPMVVTVSEDKKTLTFEEFENLDAEERACKAGVALVVIHTRK